MQLRGIAYLLLRWIAVAVADDRNESEGDDSSEKVKTKLFQRESLFVVEADSSGIGR